jgi:transposase
MRCGRNRANRQAKVASEPETLIEWFRGLGIAVTRIGLEAGPLSQWLYAGIRDAGLAVELLETRHVRDAFKAMPVKTDRKDARGIAQLMRLGWFRPVHCKSLPAQEVRALLTARKLLQTKNHDVEMSLRGVLRGFGLKVGPTTPRTFPGRIRELVAGHTALSTVVEALLAGWGRDRPLSSIATGMAQHVLRGALARTAGSNTDRRRYGAGGDLGWRTRGDPRRRRDTQVARRKCAGGALRLPAED